MAALLPASAARLSMFPMLLAVLVLAGRLLAPGLPTSGAPAGDLAFLVGGAVICHSGGANDALPDQDPAKPAGQAFACLLCPACHVTGQVALSVADRALIPRAPITVADHAAQPPPATGPPHPVRLAARPTGPPALSI